jgi:hypothetical protein
MKFIFPQNYNLKSKIFGIIEYQTAILDAVWIAVVLILVNLIFNSLNLKIFVFIVLVFPVLILSVVGINGESIVYVASYMLKYIFRQKVILYDK